jgi:hypothetical protein
MLGLADKPAQSSHSMAHPSQPCTQDAPSTDDGSGALLAAKGSAGADAALSCAIAIPEPSAGAASPAIQHSAGICNCYAYRRATLPANKAVRLQLRLGNCLCQVT